MIFQSSMFRYQPFACGGCCCPLIAAMMPSKFCLQKVLSVLSLRRSRRRLCVKSCCTKSYGRWDPSLTDTPKFGPKTYSFHIVYQCIHKENTWHMFSCLVGALDGMIFDGKSITMTITYLKRKRGVKTTKHLFNGKHHVRCPVDWDEMRWDKMSDEIETRHHEIRWNEIR